jgi:ligand-binding sensor domain-containing protein/signal transduction histidine kinase
MRCLRLDLLLSIWAVSLTQAEQPVTRIYTTEDGLVRNWVARIRSDSRGRLWFCTVEGLSLFDGEKFSNYTTAQGLPHRIVNDILEAGDGVYWLATGAGLYRFRPRTTAPAAFEKVPLEGLPEGTEANVLMRARNGQLWCGTMGGLERIRTDGVPRGKEVRLAVPGGPDDGRYSILALAEDSRGSIWVGAGVGLFRYDAGAVTRSDAVCPGKPHPIVRALLTDRDGILWAGFDLGISRLDVARDPIRAETECFDALDPLARVQTFHQSADGEIWIGARGLYRYRPGAANSTQRFSRFDRAPPADSQYIHAIAEDSGGNRWLTLETIGVMRILRQGFSLFTEADGLESRRVVSVFEGRDGTLYAVTGEKHTLNRFDGERFHAIALRAPPSVTSFGAGEHAVMLQARDGDWWIVTGHGVLRYPGVARAEDLAHILPSASYLDGAGSPGESISRLYEDRSGNIWIGAPGLARWNRATGRMEYFTEELQRILGGVSVMHSFAEDAAGNVWIGFFPAGLARYRDGRWRAVTDGLPAGAINGLIVDHLGRLWAGSGLGGLARIDHPEAAAPRFSYYLKGERMRSDHVVQLAEDRSGRIYIAGGRGVDRLDPATDAILHFAAGIGPPPGETRVLYRDRTGAIWFGSGNGLARYFPEPDPSGAPPAPAIREVRVSGVPVLVSDQGEQQAEVAPFQGGRSSIEIGFGSIDFSVGNRVLYKYRLLPAEAAWQSPSPRRSVQYAGLGPNRYRFEVQAVGASGAVSPVTAAVTFRVVGPVWKAWWFLLLAGASAVALVYSAYLYRLRYQLALERVRAHLAADLHDDLGSGLAEIAILTEVANQRSPAPGLDAIAQRARELRHTMSDIVWAVDPSADDLDHLINRWRQIAYALLGNGHLEFVAPEAESTSRVELTSAVRRDLLLLFKEIVTNVARHAGARRIRVQVAYAAGWLDLEVHDNGCGFDPQREPSGNGLKSIRRRAGALRGTLTIESRTGEGTIVVLRVPLPSHRISM